MNKKPIATVAKLPRLNLGWHGGQPMFAGLEEHIGYRGYWSLNSSLGTSNVGAIVVTEVTESVVKAALKYSPLVLGAKAKDLGTYLWKLTQEFNFRKNSLRSVEASSYAEAMAVVAGNTAPFEGTGIPRGLGSTDNSWVIIPGIPDFLVASVWAKLTDGGILTGFYEEEGVLQKLDLSNLDSYCEDYRVLLPLGCLSCPANNKCASHLTGNDFPTPEVDKDLLKKSIARLPDVDSAPPSVLSKYHRNISVIDINMAGAEEMLTVHRELTSLRAEARKFYKNNCDKCSLKLVCGSNKLITQSGEKSEHMGKLCSGKTTVGTAVTLDNYTEALPALVSMLDNFNVAGYSPAAEVDSKPRRLKAALQKLTEWIASGSKVPRELSYYLTTDRYVMPQEFMDLVDILDLRGGYNSYLYFANPWVSDITSDVAKAVQMAKHKSCGWLVLGPRQLNMACSSYPPYRALRFVDVKLSTKIEGITSSRGYTKKLGRAQARLNLICYLIRVLLLPTAVIRSGSFGNTVSYVCPAVTSYKHWNAFTTTYSDATVPDGQAAARLVESTSYALQRAVGGGYHTSYLLAKNLTELKEVL